jgi:hypothetical protein
MPQTNTPRLRQFPHRIVIYVGIGLFFIFLPWIGNSFLGVDDTICANKFDFADSGWCLFGAWALAFGAMSASCWWAVQAAVIFWNIALLRAPEAIQKLEWLFHCLAWGFSLISASVLSFAVNSGGGIVGSPICTYTEINGAVWALQTAPFIIFLLMVLISSVGVLVRIAITTSVGARTSLLRRNAQLLVIVFAVSFLNVIVADIATSAYYYDARDQVAQKIGDWFACVIAGFVPYPQCSALSDVQFYNVSLLWYGVISFSTVGIIFGLVFLLLKRETRQVIARSVSRVSSRASFRSSSKGSSNRSTH